MVVLYIFVRLYIIFQILLRCLFSGKIKFDHFPAFALKLGLVKCPEIDLKFCLEKIGFLFFVCFCVFLRSFWHRKILRKKMVKTAKVLKINSNLFFSGKWLQKIYMKVSNFRWFCLVRFLPISTLL
jgi:hypothetical protein